MKMNLVMRFANSLELFYLCKVIECGVASDNLCDENKHHIEKDSSYILANYYEKKSNSDFSKNRHSLSNDSKTSLHYSISSYVTKC